MTNDPKLDALERLVGTWTTEATHPAMPGVVVRGTAVFEWLEGERFLIQRARNDHPDFPDSIAILGSTARDRVAAGTRVAGPTDEPLRMHYYDSRGVFRDYEARIDAAAWRTELSSPGLSQRFTGTFSQGGDQIDGLVQMCEDDRTWHDDLRITYRRAAR